VPLNAGFGITDLDADQCCQADGLQGRKVPAPEDGGDEAHGMETGIAPRSTKKEINILGWIAYIFFFTLGKSASIYFEDHLLLL